jgi:TolB-like protein
MGIVHSVRATIRFGVFEADFRAGELRKRGVKVKLQEQPLQILEMLLQHPGQVVTRQELQQKIWPPDTFVDFEQGLYNAVRRLRDALSDSAEKPRFIETLSRRGYRFIGTVEKSVRKIESLAVLPLENLSRDPEQEYFSEGLTEELITTLAKIGGLRVVSRSSVMVYKETRRPLPQIARELGVDAIVEGTVLRVKDRVRITAQLIDASRQTHVWAESYDRHLRDVLDLQAEVAQAIAREVRVKLTPQEQGQLAQARTVDPEAYESYLKGRYHWNRRSGEGLQKGIKWFQQAIAKDSAYAAAFAGLADCLSVLGMWGFVPPDEGCGKAKVLALKALELDPSLAEAHASLAFASMFYDYDFITAEREFERSIELSPRYATAHQWFGFYLGMMDRFDKGYAEVQLAIRFDPLSGMIQATLGYLYGCARRYDEAISQFEKALELDPEFALGHWGLGLVCLFNSMHTRAISLLRKGVQLSRGSPSLIAGLGHVWAATGHLKKARSILEELEEFSKQRYVMPYYVARIHAALNDNDAAFRLLETAYRERAPWMVTLKTDPSFDGLRSDPHFQDLLRRMNFPAF